MLLIFVFLLLFVTGGCGSNGNSSDLPVGNILENCMGLSDENFDTMAVAGDSTYEDSYSNLYGLNRDLIDDGGILYTQEGGLADEISIFHLKDNGNVSLAKDKLNARIDERHNAFSGYKPEETKKLENAIVMVQGDYVALIVADNPEDYEVEIRRTLSEK